MLRLASPGELAHVRAPMAGSVRPCPGPAGIGGIFGASAPRAAPRLLSPVSLSAA